MIKNKLIILSILVLGSSSLVFAFSYSSYPYAYLRAQLFQPLGCTEEQVKAGCLGPPTYVGTGGATGSVVNPTIAPVGTKAGVTIIPIGIPPSSGGTSGGTSGGWTAQDWCNLQPEPQRTDCLNANKTVEPPSIRGPSTGGIILPTVFGGPSVGQVSLFGAPQQATQPTITTGIGKVLKFFGFDTLLDKPTPSTGGFIADREGTLLDTLPSPEGAIGIWGTPTPAYKESTAGNLFQRLIGSSSNNGTVCTADVRQCFDGSYVSRIPEKKCVFTACPEDVDGTCDYRDEIDSPDCTVSIFGSDTSKPTPAKNCRVRSTSTPTPNLPLCPPDPGGCAPYLGQSFNQGLHPHECATYLTCNRATYEDGPHIWGL